MKKIYLDAYLFENLGDDLFVKMISDRYPNCKFYCETRHRYKIPINKNVKIYSGFHIGIINKFFEKFFKKEKIVGKIIKEKCDYMVSIGGSIFMEPSKIKKAYKQFCLYDSDKKTYILGANFGPYRSKEYKNLVDRIISKCEDVCFRDKYSFEEFTNNHDNVRYCPDIVFGLDSTKYKINTENTAVISIIDCAKKISKNIKEKYENYIIEIIKKLVELDIKPILYSFCKTQGDEQVINSIINKCNKEGIKNISKYFYRGNIDEAIEIIAKSKIVIGTRFHAIILGILFKKEVVPIAYSDKTINVLKDLKFNGEIIDLKKSEYPLVENLFDNIKKIKVQEISKNATQQFEALDKVLREKNTNEEK